MAISGNVQIKVNPEDLIAKAETVTQYINKVVSSFDSISEIINGTNYYWIGEAGDLHRKMYNEEKDNIDTMFRRLKEHPRDLMTMAGAYADTEKAVEAMATELPGDVIV